MNANISAKRETVNKTGAVTTTGNGRGLSRTPVTLFGTVHEMHAEGANFTNIGAQVNHIHVPGEETLFSYTS